MTKELEQALLYVWDNIDKKSPESLAKYLKPYTKEIENIAECEVIGV